MSPPAPDREPSIDATGTFQSLPTPTHVDQLCDRFVRAWRSGEEPRIEECLSAAPAAGRSALLLGLLREELGLRKQAGESFTLDQYLSRFPEDRETVAKAFALTDARSGPESTFNVARSLEEATHDLSPATAAPGTAVPVSDRYYKVRKLGEGAFGAVWLAEDLELRRLVALKEPRAERLRDAADVEMYLAEARVLASLDHPHIVPVYDVGRTAEGSCYVVSKLIDGLDLADYIKQKPLLFDQSAQLVTQVAEALQHTHNRGLVHRDIKPANILVDGQGRPYVTDFGLALREEDFGKQHGIAGTPAYMSPEQARGEGHLVDGRSDIFSLGVVLYELLTGTKPFSGAKWQDILEQITTVEAKPLRQRNEAIPKELERICLKALSKRAADRYPCAADLAEDLRQWSTPSTADEQPPASAKIVPKGLRSFDVGDSDFFLELLPGACDRDGLPESLRFWKTRIEETDPDKTFRVGLVFGSSGCGKSSLMKAGLLPRLADHVIRVFLEATPDQTEQQLLQGLRRACADLPRDAALVDALAAIRRGKCLPAGRKLVLVLDQFEQWLYAHGTEQNTELSAALRQCDGERIQTVLLVRDDFWVPASRFMQQLEVRVVDAHNAALVDLFDPLHARKVLAEFGKAYGRLPKNLGQLSQPQEAFLDQAVSGLAQDGKVICVRLALFADMMKGREWTPAALHEVGGTAGVGATFLEETFSSRTAPPQHRHHQEAARAVLRALLPSTGTNIKGHMRTAGELQDACGYSNQPQNFAELMRILDSEVRLITPMTSEGQEPAYQLTHDYLVPSLRDWLTRKQRETRQGRAELRLAERTALWTAKPENRFLPSLWEYTTIWRWTKAKTWSDQQRRMMARAARVHGLRSALRVAALVALVAIGTVVRTNFAQKQEATRIRGLVGELTNAEPAQVPGIAEKLAENPDVAATFLAPLLSASGSSPDEKRAQLHARLATVSRDPSLVEPLVEELLAGKVTYVIPIRQLLRPSAATLTERLRNVLRNEKDPQRRFRAVLALADYVTESESASWTEPDPTFVARQLVSENAEFQPLLREALRPIRGKLLPELERIFIDSQATEAQRLGAANAFADYAVSDIGKLSQLLTVATPEQYGVLYPLVAANPSSATVDDLSQIAATLPADDLGSVERVAFGQRRANSAVTMLRLGERKKVLSVFEMTDDPEALAQFIFRCRERGVGVEALLDCLQLVSAAPKDRYPPSSRYALLLALGEFTLAEMEDAMPTARRDALLAQLADWYANDPSSGVHGAAGWLLRYWGQTEVAIQIDQTPLPYSPDREWFTLAITVQPTPRPAPLPPKTFYYTFVVFPEGEYKVGSVADEPERSTRVDETRRVVKLTRPFALLDREITLEELSAFHPRYAGMMQHVKALPSDPGFNIDWYDSVAFCRWLGEQWKLSESDQPYASPKSLDIPREPRNRAPRDWPVDLSRRGFRLPTVAEWEISARAGARTAYGYGSDVSLLGRFGWYLENSGKHGHPPKELRPSVRGLFDLHGNIFEWTHDWDGPFGAHAAADPVGPPGGSARMFGGGCWSGDSESCRSAARYTTDPIFASIIVGFRLALSPSGVSSAAE